MRYGYDRADNLVSVAAPEGEYRYSYDAADRPVSLSRPNSTSTTYSYDAAGNVSRLETTGPAGALISCYAYGYDAEGRIAAEDATVFGGSEHRVARTFAYDGDGRLALCEASGTEGAWAERYSYDNAGNRTSLERTGDEPDTVAYAYDADDRLVRAESASHGVTEYSYDAAGQLVSKRVDGDGETTYEYSVEGRLAAVKAGGRTLMAATYDGDGNRIMQASPYHEDVPGTEGSALDGGAGDEGAADEGLSLWSIGLFWYGFAAGGAAALAAANPAAMAASVEVACALVEATWPEGAFDSAASDYALAHLGLPAFDLAAMTGSYGVGEPGRTDELLDVVTYTNSSVVGDVAQVASSHSTRSGESAEVYGLDRLSKSEGGSATAYAYDGRGSVAQTLGASGSVASWHVWGAFGEQEAGSALGELPSYGFNGEESHPQTGLQYLRARYYDASTGRFGVQDSYLGQTSDPLSLNRYLYCLSDPLNLIDPSGYASNRINMTVALQPMRPRPSYPIINSDRVLHPRPTNYIYADVPVGRWHISAKEARNTTKYGIANWNYGDALRTGAPPDVVEAYRRAAHYYRAKLLDHYCGTAVYQTEWTYNRDVAINYAKVYSAPLKDSEELREVILGYIFGIGRNPAYERFPYNCANFVSQVLAAGGMPQTEEWHSYAEYVFGLFGGVSSYQWNTTLAWTCVPEQFEFYSNPSNGRIEGSVLNVYGAKGSEKKGKENVSVNDVGSLLSGLGVQKGDLIYFYDSNGKVHHAGMVSSVDTGEILYTANSISRFDASLESALEEEAGVYIVRLKDRGVSTWRDSAGRLS